jgi:hypothetical protein
MELLGALNRRAVGPSRPGYLPFTRLERRNRSSSVAVSHMLWSTSQIQSGASPATRVRTERGIPLSRGGNRELAPPPHDRANIGVHHVHHLCNRIPYYRLGRALRDNPALKDVGRVTLLQGIGCVRPALWDEAQRRMISFRQLRPLQRPAAGSSERPD